MVSSFLYEHVRVHVARGGNIHETWSKPCADMWMQSTSPWLWPALKHSEHEGAELAIYQPHKLPKSCSTPCWCLFSTLWWNVCVLCLFRARNTPTKCGVIFPSRTRRSRRWRSSSRQRLTAWVQKAQTNSTYVLSDYILFGFLLNILYINGCNLKA